MITSQHIAHFQEHGFVVIEGVLTEEQVSAARDYLHQDILSMTGIEHGGESWFCRGSSVFGARLKSPGNNMLYRRWKLLDINLNQNVVCAYEAILRETYGSSQQRGFEHPFGPCYNSFCYIDRVCYRLPDIIHAEGGLSLHLDRNPLDPYLLQAGGLEKWRPIQGFVCLTDHNDSSCGGLKVVSDFHNNIDSFFEGNPDAEAAVGHGGEFFRMNSKRYTKLEQQLQTVYAPKGSLVLWDSRLPHATCGTLGGTDSREVVYCGFLPDTVINRKYMRAQLRALLANRRPSSVSRSPVSAAMRKHHPASTAGTGKSKKSKKVAVAAGYSTRGEVLSSDQSPCAAESTAETKKATTTAEIEAVALDLANNGAVGTGYELVDRDWEESDLTPEQRRLLGFDIAPC